MSTLGWVLLIGVFLLLHVLMHRSHGGHGTQGGPRAPGGHGEHGGSDSQREGTPDERQDAPEHGAGREPSHRGHRGC